MRVHVVINERAGRALDISVPGLVQEVRSAFELAGHEVAVDVGGPDSLASKFDMAVATRPDALIAGGGDGTVTCAARMVLGKGILLGILPLGTVNRLARDLGLPLTLREAALVAAQGVYREIDAAEVNGRIFLCNSMLGLPLQITEERQYLRGRSLRERLGGYFKLLKTILRARRRIYLSIDDERSKRKVRAISVAVSNNIYRRQPSLVFTRQTLAGGVLGVYVAKPRSGLGLLWVLMRAALGLWTGDSRLDSASANHVTINSSTRTIRLSNDGEVETFEMPLSYNIHPKALRVLAPPAYEP